MFLITIILSDRGNLLEEEQCSVEDMVLGYERQSFRYSPIRKYENANYEDCNCN